MDILDKKRFVSRDNDKCVFVFLIVELFSVRDGDFQPRLSFRVSESNKSWDKQHKYFDTYELAKEYFDSLGN